MPCLYQSRKQKQQQEGGKRRKTRSMSQFKKFSTTTFKNALNKIENKERTYNPQQFKRMKKFHSKTFRNNIKKGKKTTAYNIFTNQLQEAARRKKSGLPRVSFTPENK